MAVSKQSRKYGTKVEQQHKKNIKRHTIEGIRILLEEEKFKLAKACIDEYIEEYGKDCYIIHEYGKYYQKQLIIDEARKYFELNIESNSENMCYSLYELSKIEKIEGNYDKCLENLISIIRSKHYDKRFAKLELAKTYIILERYKEAEILLTEIYEKNNGKNLNEKVMCYLLQIKIYNNNIEEADVLLEKIKLKCNSNLIKLLEGQLEEKKGNKLKSRIIYNDIIKNNKDYTEKASYELARLEMEIGNYERTIELVNLFLTNGIIYNIEMLELKINCYIKMHNYEKAKEWLNKLISLDKKHENLVNYYFGKIEFYNQNYDDALKYYSKVNLNNLRLYIESLYKEICCFIKKEKYSDAYIVFKKLKESDINKKFKNKYNIFEIYLKSMMNKAHNIEPKYYIEKLLDNYDYNLVMEHISKHKQEDEKKINHTIFNENIDIEDLYEYALNNINESNFYDNGFSDTYVLNYNNVGYNKEKILNYVKVVTIPNTNKIITMYPYDFFKKEEQIERKEIKIKKISRIDKFNSKYGIS